MNVDDIMRIVYAPGFDPWDLDAPMCRALVDEIIRLQGALEQERALNAMPVESRVSLDILRSAGLL